MASIDDILKEMPEEGQEELLTAGRGASFSERAAGAKKERPLPPWLKKPFVIMYGILFITIVFVGMFLILKLSKRPDNGDGQGSAGGVVSGTEAPRATNTPEPLITHADGTTATPTQKPGITVIPGYTEPTRDPNRPVATKTPTPKPVLSVTPVISISPEVTPEVSVTPEVTPEVSVSPEVTPEVSVSPEVTPEVSPEVTPEATPTPEVLTPTPTPTPTPESAPTETPVPTPTEVPVVNPDVTMEETDE